MTFHPDTPPEYRNAIVTGDARELAKRIPDESIDLIFTDPVYDRIEDYEWLAETAARVLKPDSACLVWTNGNWHKVNTEALERGGLAYRWQFACVNHSVGGAMLTGKIIAKTNRLIWADKDGQSKMLGYLVDGYFAGTWSAPNLHNHKWTKHPRFMAQALTAFSAAGAVVLDPFTGGGTVPAVCKMLGRNYIAFEIDPATAERARERVQNTQPPLFVPEPEQARFDAF